MTELALDAASAVAEELKGCPRSVSGTEASAHRSKARFASRSSERDAAAAEGVASSDRRSRSRVEPPSERASPAGWLPRASPRAGRRPEDRNRRGGRGADRRRAGRNRPGRPASDRLRRGALPSDRLASAEHAEDPRPRDRARRGRSARDRSPPTPARTVDDSSPRPNGVAAPASPPSSRRQSS